MRYNFENFTRDDFLKQIEKDKLLAKNLMRAFLDSPQAPLFNTIEIETYNRCNGACAFCPVNKKSDTREEKLMSMDLFLSIIKQLAELNYAGTINLFSNNEPLLDDRLPYFAKIAKKKLPECTLVLYTNGTLLNLKLFQKLIPFFDNFVINNYTDGEKLMNNLIPIKEYIQNHYRERAKIEMRKQNELLTTRGSQSPNKKLANLDIATASCSLPFRQMVIRPDGKVSLCCNDALGLNTMGDLNHLTIKEVWNSHNFKTVRESLYEFDRLKLASCRYCDTAT